MLRGIDVSGQKKVKVVGLKSLSELLVCGDLVCLHCPNGYGRTKRSNTFVENKLKVSATTRNLKILAKLCELINE